MRMERTPAGTKGVYLGTEIDGKWWKRYRRDGFFARGNGVYWVDGLGFNFLRYLTRKPLTVPFSAVTGVRTGDSHAGRWLMGRRALKLDWSREGSLLSSGFVVSGRNEETEALASYLRSVCGL